MRLLKLALAGACALGLVGLTPARSAEPVKIRMSWVAPLANWASVVLEKKDLMKHLGKSYTLETVRFSRHAADGFGDRQRRTGSCQPCLFVLCHCRRQCRA